MCRKPSFPSSPFIEASVNDIGGRASIVFVEQRVFLQFDERQYTNYIANNVCPPPRT